MSIRSAVLPISASLTGSAGGQWLQKSVAAEEFAGLFRHRSQTTTATVSIPSTKRVEAPEQEHQFTKGHAENFEDTATWNKRSSS